MRRLVDRLALYQTEEESSMTMSSLSVKMLPCVGGARKKGMFKDGEGAELDYKIGRLIQNMGQHGVKFTSLHKEPHPM
jgi:hypothetical protein